MKSIFQVSVVLTIISDAFASVALLHDPLALKITAPATSFLSLSSGSECGCSFDRSGSCGCDATLEFMNCIARVCDNPKCNCQGAMHFLGACHQIDNQCPHAGLQCFADHAKCIVPTATMIGEGGDKREHAFGTEPVMNTETDAQRLPKLHSAEERVEKLEEELSKEEVKEGEIGTDDKEEADEKEETEAKEEKEEESSADGATSPVGSYSPMWGSAGNPRDWLALTVIQVAIICLAAEMYNRLRLGSPFPQTAEISPRTPRASAAGFTYGLFSCFQDPKLSLFAFACPCLRWADTLEKANQKPLLKYYVAIFIFAALLLLDPITAGVSLLVLVLVATYFRQKLRAEFSLQEGGNTLLQDFMAYFCCFCCAVVQEARHVEKSRADGC